MKVTVKDRELNIRVGRPSINAPTNDFKLAGEVFEVNDELFKGDLVEGVDTWLKDSAGNFYWSGGVTTFQPWFEELRIPQIWSVATGKGVGIAIVDTGVQNGIAELPLGDKHFVFDGSADAGDSNGHGTYCAALAGLRKPVNNAIGVAPDANIFVAKISPTSVFSDIEQDANRYADAIDWCSQQDDIHIISISWGNGVTSAATLNNIQRAIDAAVLKNKIILCSIGDAFDFNLDTKFFPACSRQTIGVGSIPVENKVFPFINDHLAVVLTGAGIQSYEIAGFPFSENGTSWSNAIMAGILALVIQKLNFSYSSGSIKNLIDSLITSKPYTFGSVTVPLPTLDNDKLLTFFKN